MRFKPSLRNYLLAPVIILINPVVYLLSIVSNKIDKALDNFLEVLPKFDIDYTEANEEYKKKVIKEYFKLTKREDNVQN